MSDVISPVRSESSSTARVAGWVVAIVVWCAAAGYVAGRIWMTRWHPPAGEVVSHVWYPSPWDEGNKASFGATGWFALIGFPLGVILGVVAGLVSRAGELITLAAVLVGSCVAVWAMWAYGLHVSPPDPAVAAAKAADGTELLGALARPGWPAFAVVPTGAVAALGAIYLLVARPTK